MWQETRLGVIGSVDSGKCFAINTPILMHSGNIKMIQNIKIGDVVMGDDHKKGKKVRMLVRGRTTMYKVHQQNGIDYRVNKHHILSLKVRPCEYDNVTKYLRSIEHFVDKNGVIDMNVVQYYNLPGIVKKNLLGFKCHGETSDILVLEDGFDNYYGFSLYNSEENRRFLLADKTVVHNST